MINPGSYARAHRVFDAASSVVFGGVGGASPRWKPFQTGVQSQPSVAFIPSLADACAKYIIEDNVIDNPSLFESPASTALHLHPSAKPYPSRHPVLFPRYVYVITTDAQTQFKQLFTNAYEPLREIGGSLTYGNGFLPAARPYCAMVPIRSFTLTGSGSVIARPNEEPDDYDAGDLFIAFVQPASPTVFVTDGGLIGGVGGIGGAVRTYFGYSTNAEGNLNDEMINAGFQALENRFSVARSEFVQLYRNTVMVDYDSFLAAPHIDRYRKFRLRVYHPNETIHFDDVTFVNTWQSLIANSNTNGYDSAPYNVGDLQALANQIVADAVDFFTT